MFYLKNLVNNGGFQQKPTSTLVRLQVLYNNLASQGPSHEGPPVIRYQNACSKEGQNVDVVGEPQPKSPFKKNTRDKKKLVVKSLTSVFSFVYLFF